MKGTSSKDLMLLFVLAIIIAIFTSINLFDNFNLDIVLFMLIFVVSGYSLMSVLYPEENSKGLLRKPILLIELSVFLTVLISLILKYSSLGLHFRDLTLILSLITVVFSVTAYVLRINHLKQELNKKMATNKPAETFTSEHSLNKEFDQNVYDNNRYIQCEKCKGFYKLEEGESLEDFESCRCGGKLHYTSLPSRTMKKMEEDLINLKESKEKEVITDKLRYFPEDLLLIGSFTVLCLVFLFVSPVNKTVIGNTLGTILIIFAPGYSVVASIFPRKKSINLFERLSISFIASLLMIMLFVLILHYQLDSNIQPVIVPLLLFTLTVTVIAYVIRLRCPKEDIFYVNIKNPFRGVPHGGLAFVLSILLIFSISTTVYLVANPNPGEMFTEFYLLGPNGTAADYPTNVTLNQNTKVLIGIVNHEQTTTSYHLVIKSNGKIINDENITLPVEGKIEVPYNFTVKTPGQRKMEFLLYKLPDDGNVYLDLHLKVNVS